MSPSEFSEQFEVLYNNITSNKAPGLDEYEKSVFLTKGQDELIKNYFSASHNIKGEGYMDSPKREYDLSSLIEVGSSLDVITNNPPHFYPNSRYFRVFPAPAGVFLMLNEELEIGGKLFTVIPIDYSEFQLLMKKPYKLPLKGQAWKIAHKTSSSCLEFIGNFPNTGSSKYTYRYIKKPYPVILTNLSNLQSGLTIEGQTAPYSQESASELPAEVHGELLQRAVELAKIAWTSDMNAILQTGGRSE